MIHGDPVQGKGGLSVVASHRPHYCREMCRGSPSECVVWLDGLSRLRRVRQRERALSVVRAWGLEAKLRQRECVPGEGVATKEEKAPICEETGCQDSPRREQ